MISIEGTPPETTKDQLFSRVFRLGRDHFALVTILSITGTISLYLLITFLTETISFSFDQNCRTDLPQALCTTGNVLGWLASSVWYSTLLSQILKDAFFTRCMGLSIIWTWLNFLASTLNCFAIFTWDSPIFTRASAIFMPILNAIVLAQIYYFRYFSASEQIGFVTLPETNHVESDSPLETNLENDTTPTDLHADFHFPISYSIITIILWWIVILIGSLSINGYLPIEIVVEGFTWLAIVFWSLESFIQMALNWRIDTCEGQSYPAMGLTFFGKISDFSVNWWLLLPGRYFLLAYLSTSAGLLNVAQCLYMTQRDSLVIARKSLHFSAITFILFFVYGVMSYVVLLAPMMKSSFDTSAESWIHGETPRIGFIFLFVFWNVLVFLGWYATKHYGIRPVNFGDIIKN